MKRRDFTIGLLLTAAVGTVRAQEGRKQHRIAIVISTGRAASINDQGIRLWQAFFDELRRLGDVEGQNLAVERYSGKGQPDRLADLAREVVSRNPDLIVAIGPLLTLAVSGAPGTIPIIATGGYTIPPVAPLLAPPPAHLTGGCRY